MIYHPNLWLSNRRYLYKYNLIMINQRFERLHEKCVDAIGIQNLTFEPIFICVRKLQFRKSNSNSISNTFKNRQS